jgi:hypothetical protein
MRTNEKEQQGSVLATTQLLSMDRKKRASPSSKKVNHQ